MSITQPASAHEDRRERLTDEAIEARRRTTSIVDGLGRDVRRGRRRSRLTQAQLAERVGVHQTWISEIELGRGAGVPLSLWVRLGVVLGQPLAASFSKTLDPGATLADAGHLDIQEALAAMAVATGRSVTIEQPSRRDSPSHATDVAIHDDAYQVLILAEAWNTFGDLGAAIRSTTRKLAEATESERTPGDRVATVWVVRASAANRSVVARYPNLLATTFDGSSRAWVRCLAEGGPVPDRPGLVWFDGATRQLTAWYRSTATRAT